MKGDRKLRLVPGEGQPEATAWPDDEAPITEAERLEAERTREALERGDEPVSSSLRAAHHPPRLPEDDHEALLARALGDPLAKPTRAEEAPAAELRDALDRPRPARDAVEGHELVELARTLQAAWKPAVLPPLHNEALIAKALARGKRRRTGEIAGVVAGVLALAAVIALSLGRGPDRPVGVAQASLIQARSTMDLFDVSQPFPRQGGESSRIDRIASARSADLRANRYTSWGVR